MIKATILKSNEAIKGFKIENHGDPIVCSAVSFLSQCTINSIEEFTDCPFSLDMDEDGGYLEFGIENCENKDAQLLLKSLVLGLECLEIDYKDEIVLAYK